MVSVERTGLTLDSGGHQGRADAVLVKVAKSGRRRQRRDLIKRILTSSMDEVAVAREVLLHWAVLIVLAAPRPLPWSIEGHFTRRRPRSVFR